MRGETTTVDDMQAEAIDTDAKAAPQKEQTALHGRRGTDTRSTSINQYQQLSSTRTAMAAKQATERTNDVKMERTDTARV